jgi:hypothetical protein
MFQNYLPKTKDPKGDETLIVKPLPTKKSNLPQSEYMKNGIINKFPSMLLNVGRSGSGKSTVVNYMMTQPKFLLNFLIKCIYSHQQLS